MILNAVLLFEVFRNAELFITVTEPVLGRQHNYIHPAVRNILISQTRNKNLTSAISWLSAATTSTQLLWAMTRFDLMNEAYSSQDTHRDTRI